MAKTRSITPLDVHIADRLRLARSTQEKLSGATIGEAINVQPQQYSRYETAQNRLSAANLYRLARYFGKPVSWFYMGFDDTKDPVLATLKEPQGAYQVATDEEEIASISTIWPQLSRQQRAAVLQLLESMAGPANKR